MRVRDFAILLSGIAVLYLPLSFFPAPDIWQFISPWLSQIRATGFSKPVGNYTPAYLYALYLTSWLPDMVAAKLLGLVSVGWLAFANFTLLRVIKPEMALAGAAVTLALPSVVLNGPALGQCDGLWVGCCLLAISAATTRKAYAMSAWAGLGFAVKAQAAFLAPFCLAIVIRERKWGALLVPPAIYLLAIVPAGLAGWPWLDLLTVYGRQATYHSLLSDAPNLWAVPSAIGLFNLPSWLTFIALATALVAAAIYIWVVAATYKLSKTEVAVAALLTAVLMPYLLPNMHERYFLLADCLALSLVFAQAIPLTTFILIESGSVLSIVGYVAWMFGLLLAERVLNVIGSGVMTLAVASILHYRRLRSVGIVVV